MDIFDFEELIADMLQITDQQREDDDFLHDKLFEKFDLDIDTAYVFAKALLMHTVPIKAGLTKKHYHAFVSKDKPFMLMKTEAKAT